MGLQLSHQILAEWLSASKNAQECLQECTRIVFNDQMLVKESIVHICNFTKEYKCLLRVYNIPYVLSIFRSHI